MNQKELRTQTQETRVKRLLFASYVGVGHALCVRLRMVQVKNTRMKMRQTIIRACVTLLHILLKEEISC